jgi:hypothetical protein
MKPPVRLLGFLLAAAAPLFNQQSPAADLNALLDRVAQRVESYAEYNNWRARALTKTTYLDKDGAPEKVVVVSKIVRVTAGLRSEEILKAEETAKGKTTDITAKQAEKAAKDNERRRKAKEKADRGGREDGRRTFTLDDFLPFGADKRGLYEFRRGADRSLNGRRAATIEARSKVPDDESWNGTYHVDAESFDILRVEAWPSKNPAMVKELRMQADIEVIWGRYPFLKKSRFKVDGGIFIKRIRLTAEEEYSSVDILD